jgi:hypothetical protein
MNSLYKLSTERLALFTFVLLALGFSIDFLNTTILINTQIILADVALGALLIIGLVNFAINEEA